MKTREETEMLWRLGVYDYVLTWFIKNRHCIYALSGIGICHVIQGMTGRQMNLDIRKYTELWEMRPPLNHQGLMTTNQNFWFTKHSGVEQRIDLLEKTILYTLWNLEIEHEQRHQQTLIWKQLQQLSRTSKPRASRR